MRKDGKLTPEQMVFQASARHEFIDQKAVFIFKAKPNQSHQMRMRKLSKVVDFSLKVKHIRQAHPNHQK